MDCWGFFFAEAPGFLTQNINPTKGLANGTSVTYESISSNEDENKDDIRLATLQIVTARPGEVVVLRINPYTINVHVPAANPENWPDTEKLISGRVVLPILKQSRGKKLKVTACNMHQLAGKYTITRRRIGFHHNIPKNTRENPLKNYSGFELRTNETHPLRHLLHRSIESPSKLRRENYANPS